MPTTLGTWGEALPLDTTRATLEPFSTWVLGAGLVLMTRPLGTVSEACWVTVPTWRPACPRRLAAWGSGWPVTSGTGTWDLPEDTVRRTLELLGAALPAAGSWVMTLSRWPRSSVWTRVVTWNPAGPE